MSNSSSNSITCSYVGDAPSLEHIPLSQRRRKFSRSNSAGSHSRTPQNDRRRPFKRKPPLDAIVKREYGDCDSQVTCSAIQNDASGVEKTSVNTGIVSQCPRLCDVPATVKVESVDNGRNASLQLGFPALKVKEEISEDTVDDLDHIVLRERQRMLLARSSVTTGIVSQCPRLCNVPVTMKVDSVDNGRNASLQLGFPAPKVKMEISEDTVDDLDHIVLRERQRMLLARRLPGLSKPAFETDSGGLSENIMEQIVEQVNGEIYSVDGKTTAVRDQCDDTPGGSNASPFELPLGATSGSSLSTEYASPKSGGMIMQFDSHEEQGVMPIDNDGPSSTTCPTSVKIKDEPLNNSEIHNVLEDAMGSISVKLPNVKSEQEVHNEFNDDQVEHMSLIDRLNFLMAGEDSSLNISTCYSSLKKTKPSSPMPSSNFSDSTESSRIKCTRKRKKTATDSVETALEEDAPGLLQVLLDKGVFVDEIKLYGETENDEALDESFSEDGSFSELEAVITKIFSQRQTFIKFPIIRAAKGLKASYCLACLISLVEQTRYLKFRRWPVEWGWCRDLQSFIFVFQRHNRIVLERPAYGYATYFFELVESIPVEWQIKRLVIAMKLTTCSRICLIENKELLVGEDLSEGEAKVLMEYGWTPNSGLGTMLNYRDRVVHDRNREDVSEWRSKIGKLLMDGYTGGTIVTPNIPKKVAEYRCSQTPNLSSSSPMND